MKVRYYFFILLGTIALVVTLFLFERSKPVNVVCDADRQAQFILDCLGRSEGVNESECHDTGRSLFCSSK